MSMKMRSVVTRWSSRHQQQQQVVDVWTLATRRSLSIHCAPTATAHLKRGGGPIKSAFPLFRPTPSLVLAQNHSSNTAISRKRRNLSYSRMMDMGGAASGLTSRNKTRINASKNNNVQAICFDFDLLVRSIDDQAPPVSPKDASASESSSSSTAVLGKVEPQVSRIQQVANLLNVNLGGDSARRPSEADDFADDLSLLTGPEPPPTPKAPPPTPLPKPTLPGADVRAKYAAKLHKAGIEGGLAGVERTKQQNELDAIKGDAAGHLAARKVLGSQSTSTMRWMAMTGTGALLQYLTKRSMQICLLPKPIAADAAAAALERNRQEGVRMEDLKKQLNDVEIKVLLKDGTQPPTSLIRQALDAVGLDPHLVLLVTDRDDYLRIAKEAGMVTCRIRKPNAPRGNTSAHYMAITIPEVQQVVNEINGISFNAVLNK